MTGQQESDDPLAQLEEWGKSVERRISRRHRLGRLRLPRLRLPRRPLIIGACVLLATAILASNVWWVMRRPAPGAGSYAKDPVPSGIGATSGPGSVAKGPFNGTPAAAFPSGEDGLVMPAAQAVGAWSEEEVTDALGKVKTALVAGHLDRRMLVDHDPSALLALLSPAGRDHLATAISEGRYALTAVRIAKDAKLAAEPARVSGRTTYREGVWDDLPVLEVITNYVWVYPFDVPQTWTGEQVVVVHSEEHWYFPKDDAVAGDDRGMNLGRVDGYFSGMDCAQAGAGFTAPGRGGVDPSARPGSQSTEAPEAYFQPDHTLDIGDGCV